MSESDSGYAPRIYLAGPIKEVEDSGRRWRDSLMNDSDSLLTYIDPLDYVDVDVVDSTQTDITDIELVETDLALIGSADGMLVNYRGGATWGTPMEIVYAARTCEIPIAVAWQSDTRVSAWVQTHVDFIAGDIGDCRAYLESQFSEDIDDPFTHGSGVDMWSPDPLTDRLPHLPDGDDSTEGRPPHGMNHHTVQVDENMKMTGDERSQKALESVAKMVGSSKDSHGDAVENEEAIATFWTDYLRMSGHLDVSEELTGGDVAMLMALLNAARNACGDTEADHFRDVAGYAGIGLACEHVRGNVDQLTVNDLGAHE